MFQVHESLPVAILRYDPGDAWELQRALTLLGSRLDAKGRRLVRVSMAEVLWACVDRHDPPDAFDTLCATERTEGFEAAHRAAGRALDPNTRNNPHARTLPQRLGERLAALDPERDIAFLTRVGALGPGLYPVHNLVEHLPNTLRVPTVLCYPGLRHGQTGLSFLTLPQRETTSSYRVHIYG